MRATVNLSDDLIARTRLVAAERGETVSDVIDRALRREFAAPLHNDDSPPVPVFAGGTGVRAGVNLRSNAALLELLENEA